ncbi:MAG: FAD:protein FMN transferase [bacterium]
MNTDKIDPSSDHSISGQIPKPHKATSLIILIIILVLLAIFGIIASKFSGGFKSIPGQTLLYDFMGSPCDIVVNSENGEKGIREALSELEKLQKSVDWRNSDSQVSAINRMAGVTTVTVTADVLQVIIKAKIFADATEGIFDPTAGPLYDLWKFDSGKPVVPSKEDIKKTLQYVDYQQILIDRKESTVGLNKAKMKLNLSQIINGFAVAKARSMLLLRGIQSAKVTIGRVLAVVGEEKPGVKWQIPIPDTSQYGKVLGYTTLNPGQAMATASDRDDQFEFEGKVYNSILDPKSGYPAQQCRSVTVIGGEPTLIDALATSIFIMGPKKGMETIESLKEVQGLIVKKDGSIIKSSGLIFKEGE